MDSLIRRAHALGYPGDAIIRTNVTTAELVALPAAWCGRFVEITAIGADVYLRIGATVITVDKANMTTLASDADQDGLVTSIATAVAGRDFDTAGEFNGAVDETNIDPPRRVTITFNSHADHDAGTAKVFGKNEWGEDQISSLTCASGGNETVTTAHVYKSVSRVTTPAASGTGGLIEVGVATSGKVTLGADEPLLIVPQGTSKHVKLGTRQRFVSHIASAATGTVSFALATLPD